MHSKDIKKNKYKFPAIASDYGGVFSGAAVHQRPRSPRQVPHERARQRARDALPEEERGGASRSAEHALRGLQGAAPLPAPVSLPRRRRRRRDAPFPTAVSAAQLGQVCLLIGASKTLNVIEIYFQNSRPWKCLDFLN